VRVWLVLGIVCVRVWLVLEILCVCLSVDSVGSVFV
jgi:hypothetical protein